MKIMNLEEAKKRIKEEEKISHYLQSKLDLANAKIIKLERIINNMAKYIGDDDLSEDFCDTRINEGKIVCDKKCEECVKEYYKKMEENNEYRDSNKAK